MFSGRVFKPKKSEASGTSDKASVANDFSSVENDDVLQATKVLGEEAFVLGQTFAENDESSLTSLCKDLLVSSIPGFLSLAKEAPLVGAAAGVILQCWQSFQTMEGNKDAFEDLLQLLKKALRWIERTAPMLKSIDAAASSAADNSNSYMMIKAEVAQMCAAVASISKAISLVKERIQSKGFKDRLLSTVLSTRDAQRIQSMCSELRDALSSLRETISAEVSVMWAEAELRKNAQSDLRSLKTRLGATDFRRVVERHYESYKKSPNSREWLFEEVFAWLDEECRTSRRIFWLQAGPGMGKSVFTAALTKRMQVEYADRLLGSVFFKFDDSARSKPAVVLKSIVYQIAEQFPQVTGFLLRQLDGLEGSEGDLLAIFNELLVASLAEVAKASKGQSRSMLLVFDALDECGFPGDEQRKKLLSNIFAKLIVKLPPWVKIFVAARPEPDIAAVLQKYARVIGDKDPHHVQDLREYIHVSLVEVLGEGEAAEAATRLLLQKSDGMFLYTAMITDEVAGWYQDDPESFTEADFLQRIGELPEGVDDCYSITMQKLLAGPGKNIVRPFLLLMVSTLEPLSEAQVSYLLSINSGDSDEVNRFKAFVKHISTVFPLRATEEGVDKFVPFHKSITDWLVEEDRNQLCLCNRSDGHELIAKRLLSGLLRIPLPRSLSEEVPYLHASEVEYVERHVTSEVLRRNVFTVLDSAEHQTMRRYLLHHVEEHLDRCTKMPELQLVSYLLLVSLPWLLGKLEVVLLADVLRCYRERSQDSSSWLRMCPSYKACVKTMLHFIGLIAPAVRARAENKLLLRSEICTQVTARIGEHSATHPHLVKCLVEAREYLKAHGGWCMVRACFQPPGGRQEMILEGHTEGVRTICTLPDGRVVSGSRDNIRVWNVLTGECEQVLEGRAHFATSVCALQDGRVVSGSNNFTLRVWNVSTGECEQVLKGHSNEVTSVCALQDGRVVSGSYDETLRVWNVSTGECEQVLKGHTSEVTSVCALQDGRVVSGSVESTLRVWNVSTGECEQVLEGHKNIVTFVCALKDGRVLSGSNNTLREWSVSAGECVCVLEVRESAVLSLCALQDGRVVSGCSDFTLRVWNVSKGVCELVLEGHASHVNSVCVLQDGRVISGSMDKTLRVWNVSTSECVPVLERHARYVASLCSLQGGRVVSGSYDKTLRVWNVSTGKCEQVLEGHTHYVSSLCALQDGRVVSGSYDKTLRLWNVSTGECEQVLEGHANHVISLCSLQDDRVASGSDDNTVRVWNVSTGECEQVLKGHTNGVCILCALQDGRVVSGSYDKTLRVWNVSTGECECVLEGHTNSVTSVCALQDGRMVSGSEDCTLRVWNVSTGECEQVLEGCASWAASLCVLRNNGVALSPFVFHTSESIGAHCFVTTTGLHCFGDFAGKVYFASFIDFR